MEYGHDYSVTINCDLGILQGDCTVRLYHGPEPTPEDR